MRFVHQLHAALRFSQSAELLHLGDASRRPAFQPMTHGKRDKSLASLSPAFSDEANLERFKETAMLNLTTKLATAAIAVAAASAFASPAIAGQCPKPGSMDLANAPTM